MLKSITFVISSNNHPELLTQTVSLFHRRTVPIRALNMSQPENRARTRIVIEAQGQPDQWEPIARELATIVRNLSNQPPFKNSSYSRELTFFRPDKP